MPAAATVAADTASWPVWSDDDERARPQFRCLQWEGYARDTMLQNLLSGYCEWSNKVGWENVASKYVQSRQGWSCSPLSEGVPASHYSALIAVFIVAQRRAFLKCTGHLRRRPPHLAVANLLVAYSGCALDTMCSLKIYRCMNLRS